MLYSVVQYICICATTACYSPHACQLTHAASSPVTHDLTHQRRMLTNQEGGSTGGGHGGGSKPGACWGPTAGVASHLPRDPYAHTAIIHSRPTHHRQQTHITTRHHATPPTAPCVTCQPYAVGPWRCCCATGEGTRSSPQVRPASHNPDAPHICMLTGAHTGALKGHTPAWCAWSVRAKTRRCQQVHMCSTLQCPHAAKYACRTHTVCCKCAALDHTDTNPSWQQPHQLQQHDHPRIAAWASGWQPPTHSSCSCYPWPGVVDGVSRAETRRTKRNTHTDAPLSAHCLHVLQGHAGARERPADVDTAHSPCASSCAQHTAPGVAHAQRHDGGGSGTPRVPHGGEQHQSPPLHRNLPTRQAAPPPGGWLLRSGGRTWPPRHCWAAGGARHHWPAGPPSPAPAPP